MKTTTNTTAAPDLTAIAEQLGYESIVWDAENNCYSGHGSSDPYDRSRDDLGGLYVADSDAELRRLVEQSA